MCIHDDVEFIERGKERKRRKWQKNFAHVTVDTSCRKTESASTMISIAVETLTKLFVYTTSQPFGKIQNANRRANALREEPNSQWKSEPVARAAGTNLEYTSQSFPFLRETCLVCPQFLQDTFTNEWTVSHGILYVYHNDSNAL